MMMNMAVFVDFGNVRERKKRGSNDRRRKDCRTKKGVQQRDGGTERRRTD